MKELMLTPLWRKRWMELNIDRADVYWGFWIVVTCRRFPACRIWFDAEEDKIHWSPGIPKTRDGYGEGILRYFVANLSLACDWMNVPYAILLFFFFFFLSNIKDSPSSLIANSAWVLIPTGAFVPLWRLYLDRWLYLSCTPESGIESICSHVSINYFSKFIGFIGSMILNLELSFTMKSSPWLVDLHTIRSKFGQKLNKDTSLRNHT